MERLPVQNRSPSLTLYKERVHFLNKYHKIIFGENCLRLLRFLRYIFDRSPFFFTSQAQGALLNTFMREVTVV